MTDAAAAAAATAADPAPISPGQPATPAPAVTDPPAAGAPAAGQAPADPGASAAYRPEGLPDHLLGKDERETIDKLFKAYGGAREAIAKFGAVPEAPDKYEFTPAEAVAPYLLLATSYDGTMATIARFTTIRVVCNNTLQACLRNASACAATVT